MAGMLSVGDDCGQNDECNTTHGGKVMVFFERVEREGS